MRLQSINSNNYQNVPNFRAIKYVDGEIKDLLKIQEKIENKAGGFKKAYVIVIKAMLPKFDHIVFPMDGDLFRETGNGVALVATENEAKVAGDILTEALDMCIKAGDDFNKFIRRRITEVLKISPEEQKATEMLREMDGTYSFENLTSINK